MADNTINPVEFMVDNAPEAVATAVGGVIGGPVGGAAAATVVHNVKGAAKQDTSSVVSDKTSDGKSHMTAAELVEIGGGVNPESAYARMMSPQGIADMNLISALGRGFSYSDYRQSWNDYRDERGMTDLQLEAGLAGVPYADYVQSKLKDGSIEMQEGETLVQAYDRVMTEEAQAAGMGSNVRQFIQNSDGYIQKAMGDDYGVGMSPQMRAYQETKQQYQQQQQTAQVPNTGQAGKGSVGGDYDRWRSAGLSDAEIRMLEYRNHMTADQVNALDDLIQAQRNGASAEEVEAAAERYVDASRSYKRPENMTDAELDAEGKRIEEEKERRQNKGEKTEADEKDTGKEGESDKGDTSAPDKTDAEEKEPENQSSDSKTGDGKSDKGDTSEPDKKDGVEKKPETQPNEPKTDEGKSDKGSTSAPDKTDAEEKKPENQSSDSKTGEGKSGDEKSDGKTGESEGKGNTASVPEHSSNTSGGKNWVANVTEEAQDSVESKDTVGKVGDVVGKFAEKNIEQFTKSPDKGGIDYA